MNSKKQVILSAISKLFSLTGNYVDDSILNDWYHLFQHVDVNDLMEALGKYAKECGKPSAIELSRIIEVKHENKGRVMYDKMINEIRDADNVTDINQEAFNVYCDHLKSINVNPSQHMSDLRSWRSDDILSAKNAVINHYKKETKVSVENMFKAYAGQALKLENKTTGFLE